MQGSEDMDDDSCNHIP